MVLAILFSLALVLATCLIHYEGLRSLSRALIGTTALPERRKVLLGILGIFAIHIVEIALYAVAYWYADIVVDIGGFAGAHGVGSFQYFYFSAESFTTLGLGDIYPVGPLRLLASIESINGLLLIGWSTSYTFYGMQRHWLVGDDAADRT
jgi:hypothetical protein